MNILIGTPCYAGKLDLDYLNSILDFHRVGLPVTVMGLRNESLITRGRNTIFTYFMHLTEFSHLLFLDADIGLLAAGLARLLSHEKDVIGAAVRLKGADANGRPVYNASPLPPVGASDQMLLQQVDRVGTAVFCLSRLACERLAKEAARYAGNPLTRGQALDVGDHYDVFRCGVRDGEYLSEDYWVCRTLRDLGIPIWVDWSVGTRHWGNECYA